MTSVYFIRHGHVSNPTGIIYGPDTSLSTDGRRQVELLAAYLKTAGLQPANILSSPYERTRQTTDIIRLHFPGVPISFDERLREWQVGTWTNQPLADFYAATGYDRDANTRLPPGIESIESCAKRIHEVVEEAVREHADQTVFIVSHREPLAAAILKYQNKDWSTIHDLELPFASAWHMTFDQADTPPIVRPIFSAPAVGT